MEGDNKDGEAGFPERDMAVFGLTTHEPGSLKRTDRLAPGNPRQARQTRTSA